MHSEDRPSDRSTFKKRFQKGTATLKKAADTECSTERFCRHFVAIVETAPNSSGAHGSELKPSNGKNSSIPKIIRKKISPKCSCYRFNASERRSSPCCWESLGIAWGVVCLAMNTCSSVRFPVRIRAKEPTSSKVSIAFLSTDFLAEAASHKLRIGSLPNRQEILGTKREKDHLLKIWAVPCCGGGIPFWQRS